MTLDNFFEYNIGNNLTIWLLVYSSHAIIQYGIFHNKVTFYILASKNKNHTSCATSVNQVIKRINEFIYKSNWIQ